MLRDLIWSTLPPAKRRNFTYLATAARIAFLAFVVLAAAAISQHILVDNGPRGDLGIDFAVFDRAAHDPAELVYRFQRTPFAYPPTALVLMKPLTELGYWFWAAFSAVVFAVSVTMVAGKKVGALSLVSPGVIKGLVQGQTSMLLGGLLFLGVRLSPLLGGAIWGVAVTIKPHMLFFAPLAFLVRRDWMRLNGIALGAGFLVLASLLFLNPSLWWWWLQALSNFNSMIDHGEMTRVISPAGRAAELGFPIAPFIIAGFALGAAAVLFAAPKLEGAHLIALITASSIVASPYAHPYDATALIPACVMLLLDARWIYAIPAGLIFIGTQQMTVVSLVFILVVLLVESIWQRARNSESVVLPPADG